MSILKIFDPIAKAIGAVGDIIDNVSTTEEEKLAAKAQLSLIEADLKKAAMDHEAVMAQRQVDVILAEANGKSWIQRNARPAVIWVMTAILFNNFVLIPYIPGVEVLEFTPAMWGLFTVCIGGYIGAREYGKKQLAKAAASGREQV